MASMKLADGGRAASEDTSAGIGISRNMRPYEHSTPNPRGEYDSAFGGSTHRL